MKQGKRYIIKIKDDLFLAPGPRITKKIEHAIVYYSQASAAGGLSLWQKRIKDFQLAKIIVI